MTNAVGAVTSVGYDERGHRAWLEDPVGNKTVWDYDDAGRLKSETDPLGKDTAYGHDDADRLVSVTDRVGRRREFTRDAAGRVTAEAWYSAANTLLQTQTFGYDDNSNLTSATDPDGDYALTYDRLNRPVTVAEPFGLDLAFSYDAAGNRTQVQDSEGGQQFSRYDALDRPMSREQQVGGEPVALVTWDYDRRTGDRSQVDRYAWAGGAWQAAGTTTYGYDDLGRLESLRQTTAATPVLYDYSYAYDAADRLTSETLNGVTRTYGYDDAGQLTNDNGTVYSYDKAGNRTGGGYVTGAGNRLLADGVWTYTYDDAGAMVGKSKAGEAWTYEYDLRGQMTSAASGTTSVSYAFDALGNRLQRQQTVGGVTTTQRFAYDGGDVWADLDGSDAVTARRVFGDGPDEVLARLDAGGAVAWYGTDRMGSVRTVFDNSGSVIASSDFDAFGGLIGGALADRYGYTGREHDVLTGQRYHHARVADGHRWTSEDPIRDDEANLYRYVGNEPTGFTDPSGLQSVGGGFGRGPLFPPPVGAPPPTFPPPGGGLGCPNGTGQSGAGGMPTAGGGRQGYGGYGFFPHEAYRPPAQPAPPLFVGVGPPSTTKQPPKSPPSTPWWHYLPYGTVLDIFVDPPDLKPLGSSNAFGVPDAFVQGPLPVDPKKLHPADWFMWYVYPDSRLYGGNIQSNLGNALLNGGFNSFLGALIVLGAFLDAVPGAGGAAGPSRLGGGAAANGGATTKLPRPPGPGATSPPKLPRPAPEPPNNMLRLKAENAAKLPKAAPPEAAPAPRPAAPKQLTGQTHHPISTKVARELEQHPTLKGKYTPRDPRFTTQGVDEAAHKGYQTWHRELDDEVISWLRDPKNLNATPEQFEAWLRWRYTQPDLKARFPNGF